MFLINRINEFFIKRRVMNNTGVRPISNLKWHINISNKKRFIYVNIPKNGSSTISATLIKNLKPGIKFQKKDSMHFEDNIFIKKQKSLCFF